MMFTGRDYEDACVLPTGGARSAGTARRSFPGLDVDDLDGWSAERHTEGAEDLDTRVELLFLHFSSCSL